MAKTKKTSIATPDEYAVLQAELILKQKKLADQQAKVVKKQQKGRAKGKSTAASKENGGSTLADEDEKPKKGAVIFS